MDNFENELRGVLRAHDVPEQDVDAALADVRQRAHGRQRSRVLTAAAAAVVIILGAVAVVITVTDGTTAGDPIAPTTEPAGDEVVPWSDRTDFPRQPPTGDGEPGWESRGWSDLETSLRVPASATAGETLTYQVTLANTGDTPIDLRPCGRYDQTVSSSSEWVAQWPGIAYAHRLNCDASPTLPAGSSRTYEMQLPIPADTPTMQEVAITWSLADGPSGARGTIAITGAADWETPTSPPTDPPPVDDDARPTPGDEAMIGRFIRFAEDPSIATAADIPWATSVQLGLGQQLVTSRVAADLADSDAWTITIGHYAGYTGPFNALWMIQYGPTTDYVTNLGAHAHCAGPPRHPPIGYEHHRRVSLQPISENITSCLEWFTIDLFVNDAGEVAAVTLDLYEP